MSRFISKFPVIALVIGALSVTTLPAAQADAVADALANYQDPRRGRVRCPGGRAALDREFHRRRDRQIYQLRVLPQTGSAPDRPAYPHPQTGRADGAERESAAAYRCEEDREMVPAQLQRHLGPRMHGAGEGRFSGVYPKPMNEEWNDMKLRSLAAAMLVAVVGLSATLAFSEDEREAGEEGERGWAARLAAPTGVRAVDNPLYAAECGGCHFAYQPGLLPEASWRKMMGSLADHFGENAELEARDAEINHRVSDSECGRTR